MLSKPQQFTKHLIFISFIVQDDSRNVQFTVLTDRSQGGSSIEDGQVELMVHAFAA